MSNVKRRAVLYHYPCPDGAFAALAAHLYFSALSQPVSFFPNPVYNPIRVEDLHLDDLDDVYLLDFVGPPGFVRDICSKVRSVIVLDHHKSALEMLFGNNSYDQNVIRVIDMERSGATIAYDFFKEKLLARASVQSNLIEGDVGIGGSLEPKSKLESVNQLFKYVEDADLWRWALPDSKAFSSGLKDINIEYSAILNPALFEQLLELDPQHVISQGKISLSHKQKLIDEVLEQSFEIALGGGLFGNCLAVYADSISNLRSELGQQLASKSLHLKLRGIGAVVYRVPELENDTLLKISLRSLDAIDTTSISQEYGGGGHRNASSFMLSSAEFEKWKVGSATEEHDGLL